MNVVGITVRVDRRLWRPHPPRRATRGRWGLSIRFDTCAPLGPVRHRSRDAADTTRGPKVLFVGTVRGILEPLVTFAPRVGREGVPRHQRLFRERPRKPTQTSDRHQCNEHRKSRRDDRNRDWVIPCRPFRTENSVYFSNHGLTPVATTCRHIRGSNTASILPL